MQCSCESTHSPSSRSFVPGTMWTQNQLQWYIVETIFTILASKAVAIHGIHLCCKVWLSAALSVALFLKGPWLPVHIRGYFYTSFAYTLLEELKTKFSFTFRVALWRAQSLCWTARRSFVTDLLVKLPVDWKNGASWGPTSIKVRKVVSITNEVIFASSSLNPDSIPNSSSTSSRYLSPSMNSTQHITEPLLLTI